MEEYKDQQDDQRPTARYDADRRKQAVRLRSLADYIMGVLVLGIGVVFLIYEDMGWNLFRGKPSPLDKMAGVLFILYGLWRLYRGYKKNYFNDRS
jgi:hypothetical protein